MNIKTAVETSIHLIEDNLTIVEFRKRLLELHPHLAQYSAYNHLSKLYATENGYNFNMLKPSTKIPASVIRVPREVKPVELDIVSIETKDITENDIRTYKTGTAFDIIASDFVGLMGGTQYEVSAKAGTGKTTLLSQIGVYLMENNEDMTMSFISAEMSRQDWKIEVYKNPSLSNIPGIFLNEYDTEEYDLRDIIAKALRSAKYVIIDSSTVIATLLAEECDMKPTKAQKWIGKEIIKASEEQNSIMMCIKHVTKDGTAVGSTWDKHMFTGQLLLEAESSSSRYAYFTKNRRGGNNQFMKVYFKKDQESGRLVFDQDILDKQILLESILQDSSESLQKHSADFSEMFNDIIELEEA